MNPPAEFEPRIYRENYSDLRHLDDAKIEAHYRERGRHEGRSGSRINSRADFFGLLGSDESILEIGPLANPALRGKNVKYFDVVDTQALKEKARTNGLNPKTCPEIDYVSDTGNLGVIDAQFDVVVSSHAIEHQPDLIRHLHGVARLLKPGGRYFLAIPDKRYCFDHFIPETGIADVLGAYAREARLHEAQNVLRHLISTTHNNAARHWRGDHGAPLWKSDTRLLGNALSHVARTADTYCDTHAWQFTPDSFREVMQTLSEIGLSHFDVQRVYATTYGSLEFYAILGKAREKLSENYADLPEDFDERLYLLANPDVASAGVNPKYHYLEHGRREGRKLRP
jgi:SAM-dependent methyltransferase